MSLSPDWFRGVYDDGDRPIYECIISVLNALYDFFSDASSEDFKLFSDYLNDIAENVSICRRNLRQFSVIYNELTIRVVNLLPERIKAKVNLSEGCCVEIFKKMLMLRNEKKNEWNEVEFKQLDRSIFLLSSDPLFISVVEAHEVMQCAIILSGLVCPQYLIVHCTTKSYSNERLKAFSSGKCVFKVCKCEMEKARS